MFSYQLEKKIQQIKTNQKPTLQPTIYDIIQSTESTVKRVATCFIVS